jgi:hypothetical protein
MKTTALVALGLLTAFLSGAKAREARQIFDATGAKGGLVVVIGCDNPALLAELRAGNSYLVHGLDRDGHGRREIKRTTQLPFVARSIVLTRDALLVAGGESPAKSAASRGPGQKGRERLR